MFLKHTNLQKKTHTHNQNKKEKNVTPFLSKTPFKKKKQEFKILLNVQIWTNN
jgi:hypothetical protein